MCRHHTRTNRLVVILMLGIMMLGGLPATVAEQSSASKEQNSAAEQNSPSIQNQRSEQDRPFPPDTYAVPFLFRGAIDRSPDHYLAALVEIASEPDCEGTHENRICTERVRVIDLLAARTPSGHAQDHAGFRLITSPGSTDRGRSRIGSRLLVVVVPSPIKSGVYEATAMISSPSNADVEHARHEVKRVIGK